MNQYVPTQVVGPCHPIPPHWPHSVATPLGVDFGGVVDEELEECEEILVELDECDEMLVELDECDETLVEELTTVGEVEGEETVVVGGGAGPEISP